MAHHVNQAACNVVGPSGLGSEVLGTVLPYVGMKTLGYAGQKYTPPVGQILSVPSGGLTVIIGLGTGNFQWPVYPQQLYVQDTEAAKFGWPNTSGAIQFGHHGIFPNGVPIITTGQGASGNFIDSAGVEHFFAHLVTE